MMNLEKKKRHGFTLLEILLVVAAIAILAGIVILAINPSKQLADVRNAQRRVDVNTILNAVYQEAIDNSGTIVATIPDSSATPATSSTCETNPSAPATNQICKTGGLCTNMVDLSDLTTDAKYLVSMPIDPSAPAGIGTGYYIVKDGNGRVSLCAPLAAAASENAETIFITR